MKFSDSSVLEYVREVLKKESDALRILVDSLDDDFVRAVDLIVNSKGRIIVTGVGKSGHVGNKISATLASLGTPSHFVHSDESLHGDLGMVAPEDVVIAISHSGRTMELMAMLPKVKMRGNKIIAICRDRDNALARIADVVLCTRVEHEADYLDTAPTASSTVTLAIGDALAVAAARVKGFSQDDFLMFHPGGALGEDLSKVLGS